MSIRTQNLAFNGVNGSTGKPLTPRLPLHALSKVARSSRWDLPHLADLKRRREKAQEDDMGLMFGISPKELEECGWGVILPHDVSEDIVRALSPLLELREQQTSPIDHRHFRRLTYFPGESKIKFLARHQVGPGPVDPFDMPYFLLIVGSPEDIPFAFQYQLAVQYAVGRIHFETAEEYAAYAKSVVTAERDPPRRSRRMALVGVANPDDRATRRSLQDLVRPLALRLEDRQTHRLQRRPNAPAPWAFQSVLEAAATKDKICSMLGGPETPALLFTASHGLGFDLDDTRQAVHQGALLCQDWPGPQQWQGPVPTEHYVSGDDISAQADLQGLITFHFACYGAGTPKFDNYAHRESSRSQLAPESFIARLPQRLMAHPRGGALAVVGHVDRAWTYSFDWAGAAHQLSVFTSVFESLFEGYPIGAAMEYFHQRYAELSSELSSEIEKVKYGGTADYLSLSALWTANNDARSYVILGDPAVRLATTG